MFAKIAQEPAKVVQSLWRRLSPLPGGNRVFSTIMGRVIPYTGSVSPVVLELGPGYAKLQMADTRKVRQHLNSIHAIALANLAEFTCGLALSAGLPPRTRFILQNLSVQYLKKARGTVTSEARFELPKGFAVAKDPEIQIESVVKNQAGEIVATAQTLWRLGESKS